MTATEAAKPSKEQKSEIKSLTTLRGFLAIWVVLFHFWNEFVVLFPVLGCLKSLISNGNLAVPGFFILSGFVLAYNYVDLGSLSTVRGYLHFLVLRIARIYPVHLLTLFATGVLVFGGSLFGINSRTSDGYSFTDLGLNLVLAQTWQPDFRLNWNYPSWSISSEWFAYLLFPFMVVLILRRVHHLWLATLLFAGGVIASTLFMLYWKPWPFYEMLLVFPTFFTGTCVYVIVKQTRPGSLSLIANFAALALSLLVIGACYIPDHTIRLSLILTSLAGLILTLAQLEANCWRFWNWSFCVYLGKISYSLYMTHSLAQKVLYRGLPVIKFEASPLFVRAGVLAAYLLLITILAVACYHLFEEPVRKYLRGKKKPSTSTAT
jgi:peptidoglycan/LPS O-acetylase OafA/YrhL